MLTRGVHSYQISRMTQQKNAHRTKKVHFAHRASHCISACRQSIWLIDWLEESPLKLPSSFVSFLLFRSKQFLCNNIQSQFFPHKRNFEFIMAPDKPAVPRSLSSQLNGATAKHTDQARKIINGSKSSEIGRPSEIANSNVKSEWESLLHPHSSKLILTEIFRTVIKGFFCSDERTGGHARRWTDRGAARHLHEADWGWNATTNAGRICQEITKTELVFFSLR